MPSVTLDKNWLKNGLPGVTSAIAQSAAEAAAVCWEQGGLSNSLDLSVSGFFQSTLRVSRLTCTAQMRNAYSDFREAVEFGAYAVAITIILEFTQYTIIKRSWTGTGFDWWLGDKDDRYFRESARLEISGILRGDEVAVTRRVKQKLDRLSKYNSPLPAYVVVAEFSQARAEVAHSA